VDQRADRTANKKGLIKRGARHRISSDGLYKGGTKGGAGSNCEVSSPQTSQLRQAPNHAGKRVVWSPDCRNPSAFSIIGNQVAAALPPDSHGAPTQFKRRRSGGDRAQLWPCPCVITVRYHADARAMAAICVRHRRLKADLVLPVLRDCGDLFDRGPSAALQWPIFTAEPSVSKQTVDPARRGRRPLCRSAASKD
jgi:hypothetical protein